MRVRQNMLAMLVFGVKIEELAEIVKWREDVAHLMRIGGQIV